MKVFIFAFISFIGFVNSYKLDYVPGIFGFVESVNFDSNGNIYVASFVNNQDGGEDHTFYKLSPEKEILSTVSFPTGIDLVYRMLVTKEQDVYFYFYTRENLNTTFGILRSNSDTVEVVDQIPFLSEFFYLDPYDNLYYGRESGVHILRPGSNTPIPIKNLEDYLVFRPETVAVDDRGNVYFAAHSQHVYNSSLVLLTKEELQNEVPEARSINVQGDNYIQEISDIVFDERNELWIIMENVGSSGYIKKLLPNGTYGTIKIDLTHPDLDVTSTKDRLWVVAMNMITTSRPSIYYITLDNEVVDIPELQNLTEHQYFFSQSLADSDGRAYFMSSQKFTPELGSMIIINPNKTKPIPVEFIPSIPNLVVDDIFIDIYENIWIFSSQSINEYFYIIKKGETTANIIPDFSDVCEDLYSNPVTKEIFLACLRGLVVAAID